MHARQLALLMGVWLSVLNLFAANVIEVSGIYPHLAMFNDENECGTGAVVPWANRLWVITYGPHLPYGSSDKLYEITPDLQQLVRPESVGGTPANRMIHRESGQLLIGPYLIDTQRATRVIAPKLMPGRLTGIARHLIDPANKVYYATMEEGLYEVNVRSLEVTGLIKDGNLPRPGQTAERNPATLASKLPGYHGKGLYSGPGRVIYANNGEQGQAALIDPTIPSGALAEWRKPGDDWQLVRRNQFTEVTGPGGIFGNEYPDRDPVWSIGWDARSLILMCLDSGTWHAYRLPKASHTYDGAHGWNTEWPRIRDIGERDLLMTMHGMFWRFPKTFSLKNSGGIAPRSTYLKVIGDFCRWGDRVVLGCDDTAKSEFLNKRRLKGDIADAGQSQSNLRFVAPEELDQMGPALGRGAVWLNDLVKAGTASDSFLFSGFDYRSLHLSHDNSKPVTFVLEVDARGDGTWRELRRVAAAARGSAWVEFTAEETGAWIRIKASRDCAKATAFFHYRNADRREAGPAAIFAGLSSTGDKDISTGLIYARGANLRTLRFAATRGGTELGCYDLDASVRLVRTNDAAGFAWTKKNFAIPTNVISVDDASVLFVDERGRRWRLPKGDAAFDQPGTLGNERVCREVCTERDLLNVHGTFYELPAENAGSFAKLRPIATHNAHITDYASYRGLLVMSGIAADAPRSNSHIIRSDDGKVALWVGSVDDLWQFGKPRGAGGPWKNTTVKARTPSDPFLMTGYDHKRLMLSHDSSVAVKFGVEVDFTGTGVWSRYEEFTVRENESFVHDFPAAFGAYWVRVKADVDTRATAQFLYD